MAESSQPEERDPLGELRQAARQVSVTSTQNHPPSEGVGGAATFCVRVVLRLWLPRHRMPEEGTFRSVGGRAGHCRLYPAAEAQKRAAHAQRSGALN